MGARCSWQGQDNSGAVELARPVTLPDQTEGLGAHSVGVATLAGSCFGVSDHGPVSFRRVGQSVDLPGKARRWGHDLRGSRQSGWLKSRSRPPQPQRGSPPHTAAPAVRPVQGSAGRTNASASDSVGPHAAATIRPLSATQSAFDLHRSGSPFVPVPVLGMWPLRAATDGRRRAAGGEDR